MSIDHVHLTRFRAWLPCLLKDSQGLRGFVFLVLAEGVKGVRRGSDRTGVGTVEPLIDS